MEEWRPVLNFEGLYEVSNTNKVKSLDRITKTKRGQRKFKGQLLALSQDDFGYYQLNLYKNGVGFAKRLHVLVAESFLEKPETDEYLEVCHKDGDKLNNFPENLKWGTRHENIKDSVAHGTHPGTRTTHCPRGHLLKGTNVIYNSRGHRQCYACQLTPLYRLSEKEAIEISNINYEKIVSGKIYQNMYKTRTHCELGHELSKINLIPSELKRNNRMCLVCFCAQRYYENHLNMDFKEILKIYEFKIFNQIPFRVDSKKFRQQYLSVV